MEELVAAGHSNVWDYSYRQFQAYSFLVGKRLTREAARDLSLGSMAARGKPEAIKKQLKSWSE